jgi:hypothetical protein
VRFNSAPINGAAFNDEVATTEPPVPPPPPEPATGGGGTWGAGPSHRFVVHYGKEYPEDARTPVAQAVAEVAGEVAEPAPPPATIRRSMPRRRSFFTPDPPGAAEILLAELLVFQQADMLLAAKIQADLLGIRSLREAALIQEEEEALELFMLLES